MPLPDLFLTRIEEKRAKLRETNSHPDITDINFLVDLVSHLSVKGALESGELSREDVCELYQYTVRNLVEAAYSSMLGDRDGSRTFNRLIPVFYTPFPSLIDESRYPGPEFIPFMFEGFSEYIKKLAIAENVQVSVEKFMCAIDEFGDLAEKVYQIHGYENGHRENLTVEIATLQKMVISTF